jgi:hypothetical protein
VDRDTSLPQFDKNLGGRNTKLEQDRTKYVYAERGPDLPIKVSRMNGERFSRGVGMFFKTLAKLGSSLKNFHSPSKQQQKNWPHLQKLSVRGETILTRLASGFVFLLAKPEFYSHLASWRMVTQAPAV